MIQTIKKKKDIALSQKVELFKMVTKMAAILKQNSVLKSKSQLITIFW